MDYEVIRITDVIEEHNRLGSALTIEGLSESSFGQYLKWIDERTPLLRKVVYVTTGAQMNEAYHLTGDNRYPDDVNIVSVDLDDMEDFKKIIFERVYVGARWLDDIIDNNAFKERTNN